jgi:hypothetical protein
MSTPAVPEPKKGYNLALAGVILHAVLIALIAFNLWRAPSVKQESDKFGLVLPSISLKAFQLADWFNENKVMASLALSLFVSIDLALLQTLGKYKRSQQWLGITAIGLLLLGIGILLTVSIELPMIKLKEGLAR